MAIQFPKMNTIELPKIYKFLETPIIVYYQLIDFLESIDGPLRQKQYLIYTNDNQLSVNRYKLCIFTCILGK